MQTIIDTYKGIQIVSNGQPGKGLALKHNGSTGWYILGSVEEAKQAIDQIHASMAALGF